MRRPQLIAVAVIAVLAAGAFVLGRRWGAREQAGSGQVHGTARGGDPAAASGAAIGPGGTARGTGTIHPAGAHKDLATLMAELAQAGKIQVALSDGGILTIDETPAQRDDRRARLAARLDTAVPGLTAAQRAALLDLNDQASDLQRKLQVALATGKIGNDEFMGELHEAVTVQLDQMRGMVSDDEYRALTGLEPGVDPFEYERTGVGAAHVAPPPPGAPPGADSTGQKK